MELEQTREYIHSRMKQAQQEISECKEQIDHLNFEKHSLYERIQSINYKIDDAYDLFSPKSSKNNFYKEQIETFEEKIKQINSETESLQLKIDKNQTETDKMMTLKKEIDDYIESQQNAEILNSGDKDELQCIDISKSSEDKIEENTKADDRNRYRKILRDILYKCENCNAFVQVDVNRTKMELDSLILQIKNLIDQDQIQPKNELYEIDEQDIDIDHISRVTKREKEILVLIVRGLSNKEIANELHITERTVKNHISNLFKKINVIDRTQAAVYAIKNGIAM